MELLEAPRALAEVPRATVELLEAPRALAEVPRATVELLEAPRALEEVPRATRELLEGPRAMAALTEAPRALLETPRALTEAPRALLETLSVLPTRRIWRGRWQLLQMLLPHARCSRLTVLFASISWRARRALPVQSAAGASRLVASTSSTTHAFLSGCKRAACSAAQAAEQRSPKAAPACLRVRLSNRRRLLLLLLWLLVWLRLHKSRLMWPKQKQSMPQRRRPDVP